ncbi:hypothetical protein [Thalassococcus sp. S3]|uniref:hypothetical protein n=1 Tax=Thalassococcus sp. S3 TaxID=2017482 RepID=UPI0010245B6C|nr:hypothetical protein [Thalassococcus sp. S3]QBF32824.1 hypothetical protein CFI11_24430 [Thalassococcus sp. S3]
MNSSIEFPHTGRAAVIIKAAPDIGQRHGETVCVAGIDYDGNWHRLYPVPFRDLRENQKFGRWDLISFRWRNAPDDRRLESKRVDPQSIEVIGSVPKAERHSLARRALVADLDKELAENKSFALIQPEQPRFSVIRYSESEIDKERRQRDELHRQTDMFSDPAISKEPPPYRFNYKFKFAGKDRNYNCIDWETEATFFKWRERYGEKIAIQEMQRVFGEEWPKKGIAFAMGTHRNQNWRNWLLSGVLRVNKSDQLELI